MYILEYICLKTKSIPNFPKDIPIVHNPDERFYVQPLADHSVLIGGFIRESKPIFFNGVPNTFNYSLLPDNWDDFRELLFRFLKLIIDEIIFYRLDFKQCYQTTSYSR
jgi:4-methylaminobutanoate oxidase (formaldehyde-forming)